MKKYSIKIFLVSFIIYLIGCNSKYPKIERRSFGEYSIEAIFKDSGIIDGIAKYFDKKNNLIRIVTYKNGIINGAVLNYYSNGLLRDSMNFSEGLKNGYAYHYDSTGHLFSIENHYYGNKVGGQYFYTLNGLYRYFFSDFNKNDLVRCDYDSLRKCKLTYFNDHPIRSNVLLEGKPGINFLIYFPKPPHLSITYSIGLSNVKHETKNITELHDNDRLFLDTALVLPEKGWYYSISCHVENIKDSINEIFIDDYPDSSNVSKK